MRFALLGVDQDAWRLVEQIAQDAAHELVFASVAAGDRARVPQLAPLAQQSEDWEALLASELADVVIVGHDGDEDVRADRLRKLIQARVPLIVSHPTQRSMLVCYELDMIRQESGCPILSYSVARLSSAYRRLEQLVSTGSDSAIGELEQVIFERWLVDRSPDAVREAFARDMDLARPLAGDLTRLAAMAPTSEPGGYANLGVQLSGPTGVLVRWSVGPVEQTPGVRLTAVGSRGRAVLTMSDGADHWRIEWSTETSSGAEDFSSTDGAARALELAPVVVRGERALPDWQDACRAVELADSIQRSLEKGRTVELHYEDYTEEGTFKGTMTSVGCGLLWIGLLILIVGVVAAGFRLPLSDYWPYFLLGALAIFLLLQVLQFAFPAKKTE